MRRFFSCLLVVSCLVCVPSGLPAVAADEAGRAKAREVPARSLPVPETVSLRMQAIIAAPPNLEWNRDVPRTTEEWKARVETAAARVRAELPKLCEALRVRVEPTTVNGVKAFLVTPDAIPSRNRNRLLLHFHGGVRVFNPGEAGTREAILMAGFGGFRVLSVDYRMPPDFPFPAALDDAVTVYRELLKTHKAKNIGIFGTSAGGSLTLTTLLKARMEHLPMPGAIAPGTPTVDLTPAGDSVNANEMVDNSLVTRTGFIEATVQLYANGHDLKDPLLSPVYGDLSGFPPAIVTSGTRDLYLSNAVRMHRRLRAAGVEAVLQVWEGQSHAQYYRDIEAPETREYHDEVARFLDKHLGR